MIGGVADTHTALWYLLRNPRLSDRAQEFIDATAQAGDSIALSSVSLAEIVYLVEKERLAESVYQTLRSALESPDYVFEEVPLSGHIVEAMRRVPRNEIPDLPDRIVAATALYFGVPVVSRDSRIRSSSLKTVW